MAQRPDAILCPTACIAPTMEERWRHTEIMAESGLIPGWECSIRDR